MYNSFCSVDIYVKLSVVGHAVELVKLALPDLSTSDIDIYQGADNAVSMQYTSSLIFIKISTFHKGAIIVGTM